VVLCAASASGPHTTLQGIIIQNMALFIETSKAIAVTRRGGLYGCEMFRTPNCLDYRLTDRGEIEEWCLLGCYAVWLL
jgi:hypothetical protein